jgi:hypothetical protein
MSDRIAPKIAADGPGGRREAAELRETVILGSGRKALNPGPIRAIPVNHVGSAKMVNDAGEGQRIREWIQGLAVVLGGLVGSGQAVAKIPFLPDSVQWICSTSDGELACWDTGHAGNARLVDQCDDNREIDTEGPGSGLLILRDPAYEDTHALIAYTGRALLPNGGPDGRDALVFWTDPGRALLSNGFEACRQWIR